MTLAWYDPTNKHVSTDKHDTLHTPLGQLWPLEVKHEWVGLTDDEFDAINPKLSLFEFHEAIEAKLKEKNT